MTEIAHERLAYEYSTIKDYFELLKPRVMSLVIFTSFVGLMLSPGEIHPFIAFVSILFTSLGAGASGCLNMWYDRDIDSLMSRTQKRPIVRGTIDANEALVLGVVLSIISVIGMFVFVNPLSALILFGSIFFYFVIYTIILKRYTVQNIVIGGAAGAFPPIIGWVSVSGNITFEPIILFMIIFMWTPPHFWALALYKSDDYKRANIPMMPNVMGAEYTKKHILIYSILMSLTIISPYIFGMSGVVYIFISTILSMYFIILSYKLYKSTNIDLAPKLFRYSILYLFIIYLLLIVDRFIVLSF